MERGEIDAHATGAARFVIEKSEWIEKKQINLHATLTVPRGRHHPTFAQLPEFGSFAKTDIERKLLDMFRAFQYPRWPYIFPPGTPKDRVQIIREAMNKSFADPEFPGEFKKLMGDGPAPLSGEELSERSKNCPATKRSCNSIKACRGGSFACSMIQSRRAVCGRSDDRRRRHHVHLGNAAFLTIIPEGTTMIQNILLVEDDAKNRFVYCNLLKNRGYRVAEAKDGAEAVEMLEKQVFDVVISDLCCRSYTGST